MAEGGYLRDRNLVQWLENKLGGAEDLWNGRTAASLLSKDILEELDPCFQDLQSHVKLRVLLGIVHLSYRNLDLWKEQLENVLELALKDTDDWVQTVADLLKDYPREGAITFPHDDACQFSKTLLELRKIFRQRANDGDLCLLPLEASYCSKSAIAATYSISQQPTVKHFGLKRRSKSATLRADLLAKAADIANQPKNKTASTSLSTIVPIRSRNMKKEANNSPLRGIPTVNASKLSGGFTNEPKKFTRPALKRDGGAKLIDIEETPQALKRKRKEWDAEQKILKQQEKDETKRRALEEKEARKQAAIEAKAAMNAQKEAQKAAKSASIKSVVESTEVCTEAAAHTSSEMTPTPDYAAELLRQSGMTAPTMQKQRLGPSSSPPPSYVPNPIRMSSQASQMARTSINTGTKLHPSPSATIRPVDQQQQKTKTFTVSKEIMEQAQDMFQTANKLSRPEKALILGFMAGNRENPCPQMGQVLTVRLSDKQQWETISSGENRLIAVETFFQMNYDTGEWKRLQKVRPLNAA